MVPETYIKGISTRSIDDLVKTAADPAPHNADHTWQPESTTKLFNLNRSAI
jgi:hypothetical protein